MNQLEPARKSRQLQFKGVILAVGLIPLAISQSNAIAQYPTYSVVSVGDGDTLRVVQGSERLTIRLACIDAPESRQHPWGEQATARLKEILPIGQAIQVRKINRDRYQRIVAELYVSNKSVNLQMVAEGQAVIYPRYLNNCSKTKQQYLQAQDQAKKQRLGIWNQEKTCLPYDYRARRCR